MTGTAADARGAEFGRRLRHLFDVRHPEGRKPYTLKEVAEGCRSRGVNLSYSYLSQLRQGRRGRPSAEIVAAIASHFGVDVTYFFGEEDQVRRARVDLGLQSVMARPEMGDLVTEVVSLDVDQVWAVIGFIRHLKDNLDPRETAPAPVAAVSATV